MDDVDKELYKQIGIMFAMTVVLTAVITLISGESEQHGEEVSKSRVKCYAYCPICGRRCAKPQIIRENDYINTCIFRCFSCDEDFEKKFDVRLLK